MEQALQQLFPTITQAPSLAYLRTSKGQPYYYIEEGKCLGLQLSNMGLTDDLLTAALQIEVIGLHIKVLHLAFNNLTITDTFSYLPELTFLDLSFNKTLTSIFIQGGISLQKLIINNCNVESVYLSGKWAQLEHLELSRNKIHELQLPPELPQLRFIDVSKNLLPTLDLNPLASCLQNETVSVWAIDNPFEDTILADIFKLQDEEEKHKQLRIYLGSSKEQVQVVKLIFLGNTQVGKTTLADIFTGSTLANGQSTEGINVFDYSSLHKNGKPIEVQGFDFGGQDYYHNTHLSFFERNALYLLLWGQGQPNTYTTISAQRGGEDLIYPLDYWLGSLPQLLQLNAINIEEEYQKNHIELHLLQNIAMGQAFPDELDNRTLKSQYSISSFQAFCLKTQPDEAKSWLQKIIKQYARTTEVRKKSYDLAQRLKRKKNQVILSFDDAIFNNLAEKQTEVKFLHSLLACHYTDPTEDRQLSQQQQETLATHLVADIKTFTEWIYSILTIRELKEKKKGYFTEADAKKWLPSAAHPHITYVLGFMLYYKIIFRVATDTNTIKYVVPAYVEDQLQLTETLFLGTFEAPLVKYYFKGFFHANVLTDIIFQCYPDLLKDTQHLKYVLWKNKVILYERESDDAAMEVTSKRLLYLSFSYEKHPDTQIQLPTIALRRFSPALVSDDYVRSIMRSIEQVIHSFQYDKFVITPQKDYLLFDCLQQHNQLAEDQKESYLVHYQNKFYRKGDFKLFLNESLPMKKIFISYSKADEKYKDEFKKHLVTLREQNLIDTFDDREIELGAKWDNTLHQKIEECDILVCLVSVDFLNTKYIREVELPQAIEKGKMIVPIIIKPCDWEATVLGTYNAAQKAKVISMFGQNTDEQPEEFRTATKEERDYGWLKVIKQLKDMLK
ncbi:MAG: TIR domain-containing protein [Spirosomataceae bacterium]